MLIVMLLAITTAIYQFYNLPKGVQKMKDELYKDLDK